MRENYRNFLLDLQQQQKTRTGDVTGFVNLLVLARASLLFFSNLMFLFLVHQSFENLSVESGGSLHERDDIQGGSFI